MSAPTIENLTQAFNRAGVGALLADSTHTVRWLNDAAESLSGWAAEDALGQRVFTVFHLVDDNDTIIPSPVEAMLDNRQGSACHYAGWLVARNGRRRRITGRAVLLGPVDRASQLQVLMWFEDTHEQHNSQALLKQRVEQAEAVIDELAEAVLIVSESGQVKRANARALRMFGYSPETITQQTIARLMPVPFMNAPEVRFTEYRTNPSRRLPRAVAWRKDATHFPAKLVVEPLPASDSKDPGYVVLVRDDTEAQRSVNMAQRLGRLLDAAEEEVYIFDANSLYFVEVNRGAQRNLGYGNEELMRMTPLMISDGLEQETLLGYLAQLRGGDVEHLIYRTRHRRADGSVYPVEVRLNFSREEEPPIFMAIATDISEREKQEDEMARLAHFDALTGLPNRPQLMLRLKAAMALAASSPKQLAVLFLDIDKFKSINDDYGHDVGDEVLKAFAMRLRQALRTADTVARLAGDEFVVLAEGVQDKATAAQVADKLQQAVVQPIEAGGQQLHITSSIGLSLYPNDNSDMETLLKHADEAMYEAKRAGGKGYRFYEILRPGQPPSDSGKSAYGPYFS